MNPQSSPPSPYDAEQTTQLPRLTEHTRNRAGAVALVLGLLACILALSPVLGFASFPLSVLGAALGLSGLRRVRNKTATNWSVAGAGLIASVLGFVLATVAALTFLADTTRATGVGTRGPDVAEPNGAVHNVTYKATTTDGAKLTVSYTQGSAEVGSTTDASSPWTQDATIKGSAAVLTATTGVDIRNPGRESGVTCSIIEAGTGRTVATNTVPPSADAAVTCSANDIGS